MTYNSNAILKITESLLSYVGESEIYSIFILVSLNKELNFVIKTIFNWIVFH